MYVFQEPLCTASNIECISSIEVDNVNCLPQCSGLMVTSYDQQELLDRHDIRIMMIAKEVSSKLYNATKGFNQKYYVNWPLTNLY